MLTLFLAAAVAGCGSDGGGGKPTVSATTGILADIAEQVAGEDAEVETVIPEGASPHDFQLSAQGRAEVEDSALLVMDGAGLEAGVPVDEIDIPRFVLTDEAEGLLSEDGGVDPHVWMDPSRVAGALPALGDALAEADPGHAAGYRKRAQAYAAQLTALDAELEADLAAVPRGNRELVTSHDALGYFADRYGFEVVATPFPASGAEAEASAGRIDEVESAIRAAGVPTVFAEAEDDPEVLELIADETGVAIVTDLLVEAPGPTGGYAEILRHDARLIAGGLAGAGD